VSVHPSALISPEVEIAADAEVGPFTVIEGQVRISAGVRIAGHVWISGKVVIGEGSSVGWGSVIGAQPQDLGFDAATASGVQIGSENTIREYVTVHRGSRNGGDTVLGNGNFLMTGVHLAHDVTLGDRNVLANNALLGGHVRVGNRAFLGGGAAFHQFVRVGDLAMVQGNAAISQDVPPFCVAHGQNCLAGLNNVGLRRAGIPGAERVEIKKAYHLLFRAGLGLGASLREASKRQWNMLAKELIDAVANPSRKGVMTHRSR
jgi:UDP-N-acetylglucosamine acyltransferase